MLTLFSILTSKMQNTLVIQADFNISFASKKGLLHLLKENLSPKLKTLVQKQCK